MSNNENSQALTFVNIRLLAWFNFFTGFQIYSAVLVVYFVQVTHSYTQATILMSLIWIISSLFEIPTGIFSDLIGRKKTMIWGSLAYSLAIIAYAIGVSIWILLIGVTLEGLGRALHSGTDQSLLYDTLRENSRLERFHVFMGKMLTIYQIASTSAAIISSFLTGWSLALMLWISTIPHIVCLGISLFFREPANVYKKHSGWNHTVVAMKNIFTNKRLRRLTLPTVVTYGSSEAAYQFSGVFIATLWPVWALGLYRALVNGISIVSLAFASKIIDKLGLTKTLVFGSLYARVVSTAALASAVVKPGPLTPALLPWDTVAYGTTMVSQETLRHQEYTDTERATMASISSLLSSAILAVMMVILGLIADSYSPLYSLLFAELAMWIMLPFTWQVHRKR